MHVRGNLQLLDVRHDSESTQNCRQRLTRYMSDGCSLLLFQPGEFVHTMGDAHVYVNHIMPLKEQLNREPRSFPTVSIKRTVSNIEHFTMEDFELSGYNPYPKISMEMAL